MMYLSNGVLFKLYFIAGQFIYIVLLTTGLFFDTYSKLKLIYDDELLNIGY